eukprot:3462604-Rhodomonas_salina.2
MEPQKPVTLPVPLHHFPHPPHPFRPLQTREFRVTCRCSRRCFSLIPAASGCKELHVEKRFVTCCHGGPTQNGVAVKSL